MTMTRRQGREMRDGREEIERGMRKGRYGREGGVLNGRRREREEERRFDEVFCRSLIKRSKIDGSTERKE